MTSRARATALVAQVLIVLALIAIFVIFSLNHLPPGSSFVLYVGLAAIVATAVGRLLPDTESPLEPFFILVVAGGPILALIGLSERAVRLPRLEAAMIAYAAIQAIWGLVRYPSERPVERISILESIDFTMEKALTFAKNLSGLVIVMTPILIIVAAMNHDLKQVLGLPLVFVGYFVAALGGGLIAGVLRPLSRWPLGVATTGIPIAALIYGCMMAIVPFLDPEVGSITLAQLLWGSLGIGLLVGPPAAYSISYQGAWDGED